jgi:hypothetical protein
VGWRGYLRHLDHLLLAVTLGVVACGIVVVYFATHQDVEGQPGYYAVQQGVYAAVGLLVLLLLAAIDYEHYRRWQWALYGAMVLSIAAVYLVGSVTRGSRRWIELPFFNFQPSQFGLLLLTVCLGAFLVDRMELLGSRRITAEALLYAAVPGALVFFQPDFGTASVYAVLTLALLYFYGTRWTHFAVLGGAAAGAVALVLGVLPRLGVELIKEYQMERLLVFVDPGRDPSGSGYNIVQSTIAIGSGALTGSRGHADGLRLPPRAPHRLHLRRHRRALRLRRRLRAPRALRPAAVAGAAHRHPLARHVRQHHGGRHRGDVPLPDVRQHRDDYWYHASDRYPVALRELRRRRDDHVPDDGRSAAEHPRAGDRRSQGAPCPPLASIAS